jgi:tripeptide aminopeptidase
MDTVTENANLKVVKKKGVIRSDCTTILGADDKAGIAIMLAIAHELKKRSARKGLGDIEMLFTPAEEIGLYGVTHLDYSLVNARMAYVLDSNDPIGFITTSSPSAANIKAKVHGRTAHAGVEPEKGTNAILLASKAISKMRLGRLDKETTANIGTISGGKATNIVPELVTAEGECRSFSEKKLERQMKHMEKCFVEAARKSNGRAEVEIRKSFTTYNIGENEPVVRAAQAAAKKLRIRFKTVKSGGGSDANVLNQQGITSVVVGLGFKSPHTEHEEIAVKDLELGARYVLETIRQACTP